VADDAGILSIDLMGEGPLDLATYLRALTAWQRLLRAVAVSVAPECRIVLEIVEMRPRGATVRVCAYPRRRRKRGV
jgi:hypothetical protein